MAKRSPTARPSARKKGFTPAAPSLIMPSADDIKSFARDQSGPRGRQVTAMPKRKHALLAAEFPRDIDHIKRHLEMAGPVLPTPTGYNVNVIMFQPPKVTRGGIELTDTTLREDRYQGKVGLVVGLGPDAYQDSKKFPTGPWCKLHDWVIFPAYLDSARKFTWNGLVDILVIHDDKVDGVIADPVMLR